MGHCLEKYYHPVKISERFTIVPTWENYEKVSTDELIIELDPGMAFGTGTHPTTVMSLQALERTVKAGDTVIDVGTGSGVLSIGAALLGASNVQALDLDEVAVRSARENIELNQVGNVVTVGQNNLLQGIEGPVDIVVANILAEVIVRFVDDAAKVLKPGGMFITSGIISAKKKMSKSVNGSGLCYSRSNAYGRLGSNYCAKTSLTSEKVSRCNVIFCQMINFKSKVS